LRSRPKWPVFWHCKAVIPIALNPKVVGGIFALILNCFFSLWIRAWRASPKNAIVQKFNGFVRTVFGGHPLRPPLLIGINETGKGNRQQRCGGPNANFRSKGVHIPLGLTSQATPVTRLREILCRTSPDIRSRPNCLPRRSRKKAGDAKALALEVLRRCSG
jgi:hypothetical protein